MPSFLSPPAVLSRRELLRIGGSGLMGLSLARLLASESSAADLPLTPGPSPARGEGRRTIQPKADSLIILMLNGGPSHLDMWDMKPEAPDNIRGEFKPISSSLAGVPVSEHLPKLSQQMHRACLVRSMNHSVNNAHALAVYTAMTGHDRGDANAAIGNGSG